MLHRNTAPHALSFRLGGVHYDVPEGGEVDLPARVASAVKSRRLPLEALERADEPSSERPGQGDDQPPADPLARLWFDRAHEVRSSFERFQAEAEGRLRAMQEELDQAMGMAEAAEVRASDLEAGVLAANAEIARLTVLVDERTVALAKANGKIGALTQAAKRGEAG